MVRTSLHHRILFSQLFLSKILWTGAAVKMSQKFFLLSSISKRAGRRVLVVVIVVAVFWWHHHLSSPPSTRSPGCREWVCLVKKSNLLQIERFFFCLSSCHVENWGSSANYKSWPWRLFSVKSRLPIMSFILFRPEQGHCSSMDSVLYNLGGIG